MTQTTGKRKGAAKRSVTIRISDATHRMLKELSQQSGEPMHAVLHRAIDAYRRQRFFEEFNAAYAALRSDPEAWQQELEERAAWDVTVADGLGDD